MYTDSPHSSAADFISPCFGSTEEDTNEYGTPEGDASEDVVMTDVCPPGVSQFSEKEFKVLPPTTQSVQQFESEWCNAPNYKPLIDPYLVSTPSPIIPRLTELPLARNNAPKSATETYPGSMNQSIPRLTELSFASNNAPKQSVETYTASANQNMAVTTPSPHVIPKLTDLPFARNNAPKHSAEPARTHQSTPSVIQKLTELAYGSNPPKPLESNLSSTQQNIAFAAPSPSLFQKLSELPYGSNAPKSSAETNLASMQQTIAVAASSPSVVIPKLTELPFAKNIAPKPSTEMSAPSTQQNIAVPARSPSINLPNVTELPFASSPQFAIPASVNVPTSETITPVSRSAVPIEFKKQLSGDEIIQAAFAAASQDDDDDDDDELLFTPATSTGINIAPDEPEPSIPLVFPSTRPDDAP